jgi:hypothetical protein
MSALSAALGDIGMGWGWVATDKMLTFVGYRQDADTFGLWKIVED